MPRVLKTAFLTLPALCLGFGAMAAQPEQPTPARTSLNASAGAPAGIARAPERATAATAVEKMDRDLQTKLKGICRGC
jgi:hypothetical protein